LPIWALGSLNGISKVIGDLLLNVLNSKDFLPGKGVVNNAECHRRDLFGGKMRPDEIV
jgi:hypothetical protein